MSLYSIRNSWLLADSAYAFAPYVLVPYKAPSCGSNHLTINLLHSSARNIVDWSFRCLQMCLLYTPSKVAKITKNCYAFHNICKHFSVPIIFSPLQ
ncbi:hypothetical protein FF38_03592 [Lucilia cuprina]|uniref:DDE Tnp4 domain-containing protein n=1 Tax=Lucilia cuprina TaxID=7375 RepID=A0A0L0BSG2_LUCCU|nr:hypothetical protein FF38_03592 [Lucilia cuprina]